VYYLPRSKAFWSLPNANDINVTYDYGYLRGLAGFSAGMITYRLFNIKPLIYYLSKDSFGLICILILFVALNGECNDLIYVPVFMLLVLCIAANKKRIHKLCMLRPLQYLGEISYSIYMVHYVLILCVVIPLVDLMGFTYTGPGSLHPPLYQGLAICLLFLAIVIAISSASYRRKRININTKGNAS
jgi:peptidoglycan/LPS O-acetylase OafA/YrhL